MKKRKKEKTTHIRLLLSISVLQDIPEYIHRSVGLDGDTSQQPAVVDIPDQLLGAGALLRRLLGALGGAGEGRLVVEAVQVAAGLLELLDPFLGLGDHHVAVKGAAPVVLSRLVNVAADLGHHGGTKGDVGHKVAVPVPQEPVSANRIFLLFLFAHFSSHTDCSSSF